MNSAPIVVTHGEPASIAPEITAKAWAALRTKPDCNFFLLGDANDFKHRTDASGLGVPFAKIDKPSEAAGVFAKALPVLHVGMPKPSRPAWIETRNSKFVVEVIEKAVDLCLSGEAAAMVTNPIQKDALYSIGFKHQGHTDFLAYLCRDRGKSTVEVMMLVAQDLRAVPLTIHIPLKDVAPALSAVLIKTQARVVHDALMKCFAIKSPRLAITGLNPHAGENGAMGHEEIDIIAPAVEDLHKEHINIIGPISADTAFHAEARQNYDAILCMYHDQALIAAKTLDFHGGVNVTLGLPFIRTSPDHGTALSLAGKGEARPDSLIAALELAARMAHPA